MKDGLVNFGPGKTVCPSRNALVVGGTKSFPGEDPTAACTRNEKEDLWFQRECER